MGTALAGSTSVSSQSAFDPTPFAREQLGYTEVAAAGSQRIIYERHWKGAFTLYRPKGGPAPFVVLAIGHDPYLFARMTNQLLARGYAVAVWETRGVVKDRDFRTFSARFADGLQHLIENCAAQKVQPRFALIGRYAAGGEAALISSDATLLGQHFAALRATILFDPTVLDGPTQMTIASAYQRRSMERYLGSDRSAQLANTAAGHLAAPNVPAILLHVREKSRPELAKAEAEVADGFESSGTSVLRDVEVAPDLAYERRTNQRVAASVAFVSTNLALH